MTIPDGHYAALVEHVEANSKRHPDYGPCDGLGDGGSCSECDAMVDAGKRVIDVCRVVLALIERSDLPPDYPEHLDRFWALVEIDELVKAALQKEGEASQSISTENRIRR